MAGIGNVGRRQMHEPTSGKCESNDVDVSLSDAFTVRKQWVGSLALHGGFVPRSHTPKLMPVHKRARGCWQPAMNQSYSYIQSPNLLG